jgi:hypothetical protein
VSLLTVLGVYALIAVPSATLGVVLCVMAGRSDAHVELAREIDEEGVPAGEPADVVPLQPSAELPTPAHGGRARGRPRRIATGRER